METTANGVIHLLLEYLRLETDGLAMWWAIRDALARVAHASGADLYLYDRRRRHLRQVEQTPYGCKLARPVGVKTDHIAARAVRGKHAVEDLGSSSLPEFTILIYDRPDPDESSIPLAVTVLRLPAMGEHKRRGMRSLLAELVRHIWPIATYAGIRHQSPLLKPARGSGAQPLQLRDVLKSVLDTLSERLGFGLATISLVDEDRQEIRTECGRNVGEGWVKDAHHPLSSRDIQAYVVRTGNSVVITGQQWRFAHPVSSNEQVHEGWTVIDAESPFELDSGIFEEHDHRDLVRVFVPLGHIGTIEAGFRTHERRDIEPLLINVLQRYARDVTVVIQNALLADLYGKEQRYTETLAHLHRVTYDLQTDGREHDDSGLLRQIAQSGRTVLGANNIMLYRLDERTGQFVRPIWAGDVGRAERLKLPNATDNIVSHIAETREPYYQQDAQRDPRLAGPAAAQAGRGSRRPKFATFTVRQHISSFAGVPLMARGELLGVLCANYGKHQHFSRRDKRVIELFAQGAAGLIAGGQLAREQARQRFEQDLHELVKSKTRAVILFSDLALEDLERGVLGGVLSGLNDIQRAAWGILTGIDMILRNVLSDGYAGEALRDLIQDQLLQVAGENRSKLRVELDDDLSVLPPRLILTVLCLLNEAVINALDHGQAQLVHVSVRRDGEWLRLTISDNGRGFDLGAEQNGQHRGLTNLKARTREIGGNLEIVSSGQGGTMIRVDLPLEENVDGSG